MSVVLPSQIWVGSFTNNPGTFFNTWKIRVDAPYLTGQRGISQFGVLNNGFASSSFLAYTTQNGGEILWVAPFFYGSSIRDVSLSLFTYFTASVVSAAFSLTVHAPFNGISQAGPTNLDALLKKGVVVYGAATRIINVSSV